MKLDVKAVKKERAHVEHLKWKLKKNLPSQMVDNLVTLSEAEHKKMVLDAIQKNNKSHNRSIEKKKAILEELELAEEEVLFTR